MTSALGDMAGGRYSDAQIAAWLVALRTKGETAAEIADAARIVRENMVRFDSGQPALLDTCGTGGDGPATFNISTATAIVAAAAGVPVVKHGNRAVSSRSGSVDVLQALGVAIDSDPSGCDSAWRLPVSLSVTRGTFIPLGARSAPSVASLALEPCSTWSARSPIPRRPLPASGCQST